MEHFNLEWYPPEIASKTTMTNKELQTEFFSRFNIEFYSELKDDMSMLKITPKKYNEGESIYTSLIVVKNYKG